MPPECSRSPGRQHLKSDESGEFTRNARLVTDRMRQRNLEKHILFSGSQQLSLSLEASDWFILVGKQLLSVPPTSSRTALGQAEMFHIVTFIVMSYHELHSAALRRLFSLSFAYGQFRATPASSGLGHSHA